MLDCTLEIDKNVQMVAECFLFQIPIIFKFYPNFKSHFLYQALCYIESVLVLN